MQPTARVCNQDGKLLAALLEVPDYGYSPWLAVKRRPMMPLAFTRDSETVAIGSRVRDPRGPSGRVYHYRWRNETQSGEPHRIESFDELALRGAAQVLAGLKCHVSQVAFFPCGRMLASGSDYGSVVLWDLERGRMTQALNAHTRAIVPLEISRSGRRMITSSGDGVVQIWSLE